MPQAIVRFGNALLPDRMPTDDLSSGRVESPYHDSIGGVYDYLQGRRRLPRLHQITQPGKYVGETTYIVDEDGDYLVDEDGNFIIAGNGQQMLLAQLEAIKSKIGESDQLWRERYPDGALHWKQARLLEVTHQQGEERAGNVAEVECIFETSMQWWHAETATTASVTTTDGATKTLMVGHGGQTVNDAVLTVARTSGYITDVSVTCAALGVAFTWTGGLSDGDVLTIDFGNEAPASGVEDAYDGFALGAGHTARAWCPITAGLHAFRVTTTGGAAEISLALYEQYA